jgi:hypothetical protein
MGGGQEIFGWVNTRLCNSTGTCVDSEGLKKEGVEVLTQFIWFNLGTNGEIL